MTVKFNNVNFPSNLVVLNEKYGINMIIMIEYDETRKALGFQHFSFTSKTECVHILKYYLQNNLDLEFP